MTAVGRVDLEIDLNPQPHTSHWVLDDFQRRLQLGVKRPNNLSQRKEHKTSQKHVVPC